MSARIIADTIVILHFIYILYVVFGAIPALRHKFLLVPHFIAMVWAVMVNHTGWGCPLTPLENHFRGMAGGNGYAGGFIDHYIVPIVYPMGLTQEISLYLSIAIILWNSIWYWMVLRHWRNDR